jgi:hypothetical protein
VEITRRRTFFCDISVQSRHADSSLVDKFKNHQSISQKSLTKILDKNVIVARFPVVVSISLDFHGLVVAV